MPAELICPKCHGAMRSYERNTVTVDQCVDCRGIFLDRGELDQLLDAEAAYNTAPANQDAAPPPRPPTPAGYPYQDPRQYQDTGQRGHHGGWDQGGHGKRRKGFLGELFD